MITDQWQFDAAAPLVREHGVRGDPVLPFALWLTRCLESITGTQARPPRELRQVVVREMMSFRAGESAAVSFACCAGR